MDEHLVSILDNLEVLFEAEDDIAAALDGKHDGPYDALIDLKSSIKRVKEKGLWKPEFPPRNPA